MHVEQVVPPVARPRGRPRSPQALSEPITFRVTPDEADSAYEYAKRHGKPLNEILRAVLKRLAVRES